jgi:hypothetical protein
MSYSPFPTPLGQPGLPLPSPRYSRSWWWSRFIYLPVMLHIYLIVALLCTAAAAVITWGAPQFAEGSWAVAGFFWVGTLIMFRSKSPEAKYDKIQDQSMAKQK